MKVPLLDLKEQYAALRDEIRPVIDRVCDSQQFILGSWVQDFEKHVAEYCGCRHAVGLSSGTDALLAALMALDIGAGDAVITSPFTFFATAGSIARCGALPLFADIDPVTFNLSPDAVRRLLGSPPPQLGSRKIKAIIPVHLYGQCAAMDSFISLARDYQLSVIEDAAQAIGAQYPSARGLLRAGAIGDIGCFSFFPSKNLGGFGDGGMAVTSADLIAERLKMLRGHGSAVKYYHQQIGGNFRLDAFQAAVLDIKLKHLEMWHAARRTHAAFYDRAFKKTPVQTPAAIYAGKGVKNFHIYNQYVIRVSQRDRVREKLSAEGIGTEVYYPVPLHLQECFRHLGYHEGDFPESEKAAREVLALPIYPELTDDMQQIVVDAVFKCLE